MCKQRHAGCYPSMLEDFHAAASLAHDRMLDLSIKAGHSLSTHEIVLAFSAERVSLRLSYA